MLSRRLLILATSLATLAATPSLAAERAFSAADFAAAQNAGKPILVEIHASWCPTCRAQAPIVSQLQQSETALEVFRVDYDSQKDAVKQFGARMQSTLIVFKGATEAGRSVGDTDPSKIKALVAKAL